MNGDVKTQPRRHAEIMRRFLLFLLIAIAVFVFSQTGKIDAQGRNSGVVTLDKDGRASVPFARGYLDGHYCVVADGWDEVSIGFSARGFTVSDGQPEQEIPWACVPDHQ